MAKKKRKKNKITLSKNQTSLKEHLPSIQSLLLVLISFGISIYLWQSGWLYSVVHSLGTLEYLGAFLAGISFTSVFTAAPAAVVLITLSRDISPPVLAIIGGLGSMLGDLIIFTLLSKIMPGRTKKTNDVQGILRIISHLRHTKYRFTLSVLGALIIASPLPDELGLAMMGLGKVRWSTIAALTFIMNALGIYFLLILS